jgi:ABC-2 type transport system permease protein
MVLLISNALMAGYACTVFSRWVFYDGWSRNHSQEGFLSGLKWLDRSARPQPVKWLDRLLGMLPGLQPWTRALVAKDLRVFWRDTSQWSQFVIFFGLLGLYVINLRPSAFGSPVWSMFVAFLSMGATALTSATLTTRFVFPQFSLEGRRLWIVGLAPCGLKHVLYEKFWLSSVVTSVVTLALMMISAYRLKLPGWMTLLFGATTVLMSFGLSGIAVGIGALFPHFGSGASVMRRDDNPAKIVSGFGGTFCFVMSLVYILIVMGIEAWPLYTHLTGTTFTGYWWLTIVIAVWSVVMFVSLVAITVPMRLAVRRVESLEM